MQHPKNTLHAWSWKAFALLYLASAVQALGQPLVTLESAQRIDGNVGGFSGDLDSGDRFGRSAIGIGDLDGDGVPDIAVGARSDDDGGVDTGATYILFMQTDGTVRNQPRYRTCTAI